MTAIVPPLKQWTTMPNRKPKGASYCAQPFCWRSATLMVTHAGAYRPRPVCDRCAAIMCRGPNQ